MHSRESRGKLFVRLLTISAVLKKRPYYSLLVYQFLIPPIAHAALTLKIQTFVNSADATSYIEKAVKILKSSQCNWFSLIDQLPALDLAPSEVERHFEDICANLDERDQILLRQSHLAYSAEVSGARNCLA